MFAFVEHGFCSLRAVEKLCRTDIRYMYLLDGMSAPSFATFGNFIRDRLSDSMERIFNDINGYIFAKDHVDLEHVYIDGTKIEANANRYTWVWKKSCIKNRNKVFEKISLLIDRMNGEVFHLLGVCLEKREEYAVEYVWEMLSAYQSATGLDVTKFVLGIGHRKGIHQKQYEELHGYRERLKTYARHIEICGEARNSYSKTDHDATFMRIKSDYMGNDQLLPAYNMQAAVCDEYIAVVDAKPYTSDTDCFVPLMEKIRATYGHYPKYPVADAGYGSYNNYLYCEGHGMEKYMKFTMFEKETKDEKGNLICPENKRFLHKYDRHVYGNRYGRIEEIYECEDCEGCPLRSECCRKAKGNLTARLNRELTSFH